MCILVSSSDSSQDIDEDHVGRTNQDWMAVLLVGACSKAVYVFEGGCYTSLVAQLCNLIIIIII